MTKVMDALLEDRQLDDDGNEVEHESLFTVDQPDSAHDECVRLLLEHGACGYDPSSPVMRRIIRDTFQMVRVPSTRPSWEWRLRGSNSEAGHLPI
ncbi:hypothetical protein FOA52_013034 [Chlamydomonas sp. UWO 241]|nr:hypothetical protein FOA52_013034 [Chlamydomonas sp. UWO 241]